MKCFDSGMVRIKNKEREIIQEQVDQFLADGGTIQKLQIQKYHADHKVVNEERILPENDTTFIALDLAV